MVNSSKITYSLLLNLDKNIKNMENLLKEFLIETYPFLEIKELIDKLLKIINKLYINIDRFKVQLQNKGPSSELDESIIIYTGLVQYIHSLFGLIKMSQEYNISKSIIYLIEYLTEPLKDKSNFIIVPSYTYNYFYTELNSQIKRKFIDAVDDIDNIFPEKDKQLSILIYPYIYNRNIYPNTILAHEIGHFIEKENNVINNLITSIKLDPHEIERIAKYKIDQGTKKGTQNNYFDLDTMKALVHKETQDRINYWLQELFCDLIGLKLIGPVYLNINTEFFLSIIKATDMSNKYPPIEMRLKFLFNMYENSDFIKLNNSDPSILKEFNEYLIDISDHIKSIQPNLPDDIYSLAYEKTMSVIKLLQKVVEEKLENYDRIYTCKRFRDEVNPIVISLSNLIVPCEIKQGVSANIISILNGSKIFNILKINEVYESHKKLLDINLMDFKYKIDQLVSRAIELSTMHDKL